MRFSGSLFLSLSLSIACFTCACPLQGAFAQQSERRGGPYAYPGGPPSRQSQTKACKNCQGYEMSGVDPSSLLDDPGSAESAPHVANKTVKRKSKKIAHASHSPKRKIVGHISQPHVLHVSHPHVLTSHVVKSAAQNPNLCAHVVEHTQELFKDKRDDEAEKYIKQSLIDNPQDKCIRRSLVNILLCEATNFMRCGEIECGARRLREVLFVDPRNPQAVNLLNKCYAASGIDSNDPSSMRKLAADLLNQGRYVGSFVEYERLLDQGPNAETYIGYARSAERLGQNSLALSAFEKGLALNPVDESAWREMGLLEDHLGNPKVAQYDLSQAIKLEPDDIIASQALVNIGQSQVASQPMNPGSHLALANALLLSGQNALAQVEFDNISSITNNSPDWQTAIENARREAAAWQQQSQSNKQLIAQHNVQTAANEFTTSGPIPNSGTIKPQAAAAAAASCACD